MTRAGQIITYSLYFIVFVALQVLLFLHLALFDGRALCFIYIAFIMMLPYQTPHVLLILIGFGTGLFVDVFYNSLGIHAFATVLIAYLRPYIINALTPRGGYDEGVTISIGSLGLLWFLSYAAVIIVIHHTVLFFVWSLGYNSLFLTFGKILASSVFSLVMVILVQYLIQSPRKN